MKKLFAAAIALCFSMACAGPKPKPDSAKPCAAELKWDAASWAECPAKESQ